MTDYLMREASPLEDGLWKEIDEIVVSVMKGRLVGRRVLPLVGPLGWGVDQAPVFDFEVEETSAEARFKEYLELKEIHQEFVIRAKHLAMAAQTPFGLDLGAVAIAATRLAQQEDNLIIDGMLAAASPSQPMPLGDWDAPGGPFRAVANATAQLRAGGFDAPYALLMSPAYYARLASLMEYGRRELDMVQTLVKDGIYQVTQAPALEDRVLLVSPAAWNLDLVVGQDVATGYTGTDGLDHCFRVFETLALRVKRPGAIVQLVKDQ